MSEVAATARPTPEVRRQQILDAACDCVRKSGFHGASMAEIAQAAGLSVGQIYRYFENKEAIIAAIVDQDLAEMREKFAELAHTGEPLAEAVIARCSEGVERYYDPKRAAMMLEVLAEAARNPRVAAIVRAADEAERALCGALLEGIGRTCGKVEMAARGEVISMLFEGMAVRGVNNPDGDRAAIAEVLRVVLRLLLSEQPLTAACGGEAPPSTEPLNP